MICIENLLAVSRLSHHIAHGNSPASRQITATRWSRTQPTLPTNLTSYRHARPFCKIGFCAGCICDGVGKVVRFCYVAELLSTVQTDQQFTQSFSLPWLGLSTVEDDHLRIPQFISKELACIDLQVGCTEHYRSERQDNWDV